MLERLFYRLPAEVQYAAMLIGALLLFFGPFILIALV